MTIEELQLTLARLERQEPFSSRTQIALSSDSDGNNVQPILEIGTLTDVSGQTYLVLYPNDGDEIILEEY